MIDSEIARSSEHMSREVFGRLFELTKKQPWLIRRSTELYDTIGLCSTDLEKDVVIDLISRIHFRSVQNHLDDLRSIANEITHVWGCLPQNTILVALEDRELADSSAMLVQQLKGPLAELGSWKTGNFISQLGEVVNRSKDGWTIVIVDDFCGSGESIYKKVTWLKQKLKEKNKRVKIYVAVASAMEKSKELIDSEVDTFYAVHWLRKGINDFYHGDELKNAISAMERIEAQLADSIGKKKLKDYCFGWKRSEALFYLEGGNPPNNNFPVFWWPKLKPSRERSALLPRV